MKKGIIVIAILSLLFLAACSKVYVCYDGTEEKRADKCPELPSPYISQRDAERAVDSYGSAYATAKGDRYSRVTLFAEGQSYFSDILFTNTRDNTVNSVRLEIDGKTREIVCKEGCEYIDSSSPQ